MKSLVVTSLLLASTLAASNALAYNPSGNSTAGPGPTVLTYAGFPIPCHSTFTINIPSAGASTGTVVSASFTAQPGDSTLCPNIIANTSPAWVLGPASATGTSGVYTATISGVSVTVPGVATCTGSVTVTLNNNTHVASFSGTLHDAAGTPCAVSGANLSTPITAP